MSECYYVYILRSLKDANFYTGHTSDLKKRLARHNRGEVCSTKSRRPFELVYWECFTTRRDAMQRERKLKSLRRADRAGLVNCFKPAE